MSDQQEQTIRKYWTLMGINASTFAIRAAREAGLLDQLIDGQKTFGELIESCDTQPNLTSRTLDVLIATGLVEQYAEYYAASHMLKLLAQYDSDLGDSFYGSLLAQLRCEQAPEDGVAYGRHAVARAWTRTPVAMQAAAVLEVGTVRKDLKILEFGSGACVWSAAIAFRDPGTTVVAVDSPEALDEARRMVESINLGDRWTPVEADPRSGELPEGPFDMVIVPELISTCDDALAVTLLGRAADVARAGGEVVVFDCFEAESSRQRSLATAVYNLELGLRTPMGRLRQVPEFGDLMKGAGLESPQYAPLDKASQNMGMLVAKRPEQLP